MTRIKESQLVLPALYLMAQSGSGIISTSELITKITEVMRPTGVDAQILDGRSDTHFSQKVRNLKSHNTLERQNYATNYEDGFKLTQHGFDYVNSHKEALDYLLRDEFNYEDVKSAIENISSAEGVSILPIEEFVSEGRLRTKSVQIRERSSRLRMIALEYFTHHGVISCDCCGFNFPTYYGLNYGVDCIEIHHVKPIFQYGDNTVEQTVENALKNLLPVCPNCHRVIHKNNIGSENISDFLAEMKMRFHH
jgi:predicted HNH restriction endonuclease